MLTLNDMKLTRKQKKVQDKMIESMTPYEKDREFSHVELLNTFYQDQAAKKFKKYKKKIRKSKRCVGMGEAMKQTVRFKAPGKLETFSKRWVKYKTSICL